MRTLALNPDKNAESNTQDVLNYFTMYGDRTYDTDLTAIFAFKDRKPYYLHFPRFSRQNYGDVKLPDKLKSAIERWCDKGKGWGIIHSRGYPTQAKPRSERIPLKLNESEYFFHLGGYGSGILWSDVIRARRMRQPTNLAVYMRWLDCQDPTRSIQPETSFSTMWANTHSLDNDMIRAHSTFIWNDGDIEKYNICHSEYDDSATSRYTVFKMHTDGPPYDGRTDMFFPAFEDYPQWNGEVE